MQPKNLQLFISKSNELISEIDEIISSLSSDVKALQLRKNEFRDKCLQFLKISFDSNEYFKKFESDIYEVSQNSIYLDLPRPVRMQIENELKQFGHAKYLLSSFVNNCIFIDSVVCELPSGINEQGLFFKGQYYDAIFKLSELLKTTQTEIKLVDNYINEDLINFLCKSNQAKIRIITTNNNSKEMKQLNLLLKSVNAQSQYPTLEVRESNKFHDRFLICDDKQAYHFGASLKQLGDKAFMFSKIQQLNTIKALINEFESEWQNSSVLFP
jgi:hypothetical protein